MSERHGQPILTEQARSDVARMETASRLSLHAEALVHDAIILERAARVLQHRVGRPPAQSVANYLTGIAATLRNGDETSLLDPDQTAKPWQPPMCPIPHVHSERCEFASPEQRAGG